MLIATGNPAYVEIGNNLVTWFQTPNPGSFTGETWQAFIYPSLYFVLRDCILRTSTLGLYFNANEIAENLQKQGGFIEGVRPGEQTEKYLSMTMNRLILFGSVVLGLIAVLPFIAEVPVISPSWRAKQQPCQVVVLVC